MNAVTANDLKVHKSKKTILESLNFQISSGTLTGIIGPSGAGKTTLMRAIVGVQKYQGQLQVLGEDAGARGLRSRIGYVTQNPAVYNDLTVLQNLKYFGTISGAGKTKIAELIKTVDLVAQKNQVTGSLSGGQRARVSLAVALLGDPDLLVLDEPTVGLDPILRNNLWDMFANLARQGKTLLVSSHVMDEAERCKDLLLMREGQLVWHDSKSRLLEHTGTSNVGEAFVSIIGGAK